MSNSVNEESSGRVAPRRTPALIKRQTRGESKGEGDFVFSKPAGDGKWFLLFPRGYADFTAFSLSRMEEEMNLKYDRSIIATEVPVCCATVNGSTPNTCSNSEMRE